MRTSLTTAAAGTVATMVLGGAVLAGTTGAQADSGRQITGTWAVTIDPDGDAVPSFTATIVYTSTGSVIETTMNRPPSAVSTGLGTWERLGDGRFATRHSKYRWNGTTYAGTVLVNEVSEVAPSGDRYTARATTLFLDKDGNQTMPPMSSTVTAERL